MTSLRANYPAQARFDKTAGMERTAESGDIQEKQGSPNAATGPGDDPREWLEEHGDMLFRYAMSRVRNRELAEDLVQDTFLAAVRAHDSFEGRSSVKTWLLSILKNKIIDNYRKSGREELREEMDEYGAGLEDRCFNKAGIWKVFLSNWAGDPEEHMEQKQFYAVLKDCLSKLPERAHNALTMKFTGDLSPDEVCKALGVSSSNYWVILYRARLAVRDCLEQNWVKS